MRRKPSHRVSVPNSSHHFHRHARHVEQRDHHGLEDVGFAQAQPTVQGRGGGGQEEGEPELVQHERVRGEADGTGRRGAGATIIADWRGIGRTGQFW